MPTSKETARQSYIRILESEAQRSLGVIERDVVLGAELVEARHLKGSALRDHDGEPRDVCQLDCSPAREPVIISFKDKNGAEVQKFYARSGNSSQEISLSEMNAYLKERFNG